MRFILRADKEADLLRRQGGDVSLMVGRGGGRLGDLPVAAVEVQAGERGKVVSLHRFVTLCRWRWRAQAFPQPRLTARSTTQD